MRFLIEMLIAIVLIVVFFVGMGMMLPNSAYVERSIAIERPLSHVYDTLYSNRRYENWAPWQQIDPNVNFQLTEVAAGKGSGASWTSSNPALGNGEQIITEAAVDYNEGVATIDYNLTPQPKLMGASRITVRSEPIGVKVTWGYEVKFGADLIARYKGLYLDGSLGDELQLGLARLKQIVESTPYARDYSDAGVAVSELPARNVLIYTGSAASYVEGQPPDVQEPRQEALDKLEAFVEKFKLNPTGPVQFAYNSKDLYTASFDVMQPIEESEVKEAAGIKLIEMPPMRFVSAIHVGNRGLTSVTHEKLLAYMSVNGLLPRGRHYEEYLSPAGTDERDFESNVVQPILNPGETLPVPLTPAPTPVVEPNAAPAAAAEEPTAVPTDG